MSRQHRNDSRCGAPQAPTVPLITSDHRPRKLVCALAASAPMLLVCGHKTLHASALISLSLSKAEKASFLDRAPTFSQSQADELAAVFDGERQELGALTETEGSLIALLQARALWDGLELVRERLGFCPALRNAWLRRTVRLAARRNGLEAWLCRLWPHPADWAVQGILVRRVYREALPRDHPAWQARDDDAALCEAARARGRELAAAQARDSGIYRLPASTQQMNLLDPAASVAPEATPRTR